MVDGSAHAPTSAQCRRPQGERRERLEGEDYYGVVEEFCTAVKKLWPNALLQARSVGGTVVGQGVECLHACTHAIRFALHAGPLTLTCTCLVPPSSHLQFEDFQTERVR